MPLSQHSGTAVDLRGYLPNYLVAALRAQRTPGSSHVLRRFDGIAMVVDIAGFTSLTEDFARSGPGGAERLSAILDLYFGRMTDLALAHGGDVVDFVGDCMLVTWAAGGPREEAGMLAVQCAIALQAALPGIVVDTGTELTQRIAIAAGALAQLELGGLERRYHALTAGAPFAEAARSYHYAAPGDFVVAGSLVDAIRERCDTMPAAPGVVRVLRIAAPVPLPPEGINDAGAPVPSLEPYVPRAVLDRLRTAGSGWFGEFRQVTTLFLGLPGIDCSGEAATHPLQVATRCVQTAHARFGGSLTRVSVDDKGVTLLSAFGLPHTATEDDADRALAAALHIEAELAASDIGCAIGLATGRIFYGDVGGSRRRHVCMVGVSVNTAAHIMVEAGAGILCDAATQTAAARTAVFDAPHTIFIKRRSQPTSVARPRALHANAGRVFAGSVIGREAERERLEGALHALAAGESPVLVLRGEAGIGKSRLLASLISEARARGARVAHAVAAPLEHGTPYFVWRQIVSQALCGDARFSPVSAREALDRLIGDDPQIAERLPLLNDVIALGLADTPLTRELAGAARASTLRSVLRSLLAAVAKAQDTLLVVDDVHWLDDASAAALHTSAFGIAGLLVVCGTRPLGREASSELRELLASPGASVLELGGLGRGGVAGIICGKLQAASASPDLTAFVYGRTAGNPFYVEELVLAMHGAGLIETRAGAVVLAPGVGTRALEALPDSLRAVIVSRVDALGMNEQLALKTAAVIGREFSLPMLRELHPHGDEADLEGVLEVLLRVDIVHRAAAGVRGDFEFKHAILQDVVYDQLPFALRRELHAAAAAWIEAHESRDLEAFYPELALHCERCGAFPKAVDYLERSAVLSFGRYANREAIDQMHRAMHLADQGSLGVESARQARWEALLGDAHHELFEYDAAQTHFKRGLSIAGMPVPERAAARALELGPELLRQIAARSGWTRGLAAGGGALAWASHIHERLAEIAYFEGRPLDLLHSTLLSLNLAERSGAVRETVDGLAALSMGLLMAGLRRVSRLYNRRSVELAESRGSRADVAYAHLISAIYWLPQARWDIVESSLARAETILSHLGGTSRWQQSRTVLITAELARGRFAEARDVLDALRKTLSYDTPTQIAAWADCFELYLALARGTAYAHFLPRLEAFANGSDLQRVDRMLLRGVMALAYWRLGERGNALRAAQSGLADLLAAPAAAMHLTIGISGIVQTLQDAAECGEWHDGRAVRRACAALRRYGLRIDIATARAALHEGRLAAAAGRANRACQLWLSGLRRARELGMPYDEALILYEIGTRGASGAGERAARLHEARAIFRSTGAVHDLDRVEDAMSVGAVDTLLNAEAVTT